MRASLRFGVILGGSLVVLLSWMASAGAEGPDDVGLFDPNQGQWHIGGTSFFFGNPNDVPIVGDWDCDGDETVGVFRPSGGDAGTVAFPALKPRATHFRPSGAGRS